MKTILALCLFWIFNATAVENKICGQLSAVADYQFSLGTIQYIEILPEDDPTHYPVLIHSEIDVKKSIEALFQWEVEIPDLPMDNIFMAYNVEYTRATFIDQLLGREVNPYMSGLHYIYRLEHEYYVCAVIEVEEQTRQPKNVLSYQLYLNQKLIYQRDKS